MLNNSLVIGLAIISLVCVYLIWEHFKMSAKLKYLEMSIHETVQTVQGLVNNNLCLPPQHQQSQQHHPFHTQQQQPHQPQQPQQSPQPQHQQQPPQEQQQKKEIEGIDISKLAGGLFQSGGGVFQNILTNLMSSMEQSVNEGNEDEDVDDEENDEMNENISEYESDNDNEIQEIEIGEIEPLEITEELKEQIDNLTFNEPEEQEHQEELNVEDFGELEEVNDKKEEVEFDNVSEIEELGDIKFDDMVGIDINQDMKGYSEMENENGIETETETETETEREITNETKDNLGPEELNHMTLKQLQDIAEKLKLGKRGTKEQLITRIKRSMKMSK
jgi:hypothetical protein